MPEPGAIYYSARTGQFSQVGKPGFVSRETGVKFIEYNPRLDRYVDQLGRFVPKELLTAPEEHLRRFVSHDIQGRPFLSAEFKDVSLTRAQLLQTEYTSDVLATIRTTTVTADGKVHVSEVSSKLGRTPDMQQLEVSAVKKARADLLDEGYEIDTDGVRRATVHTDYIRRTVRAVKRGE